jgi:NAD(P)-dependent dehydrogenase (short-subunit alcohol dehydrogenase family)
MNAQPRSPVWLVTGCSSGIGRALAEALVEQGQSVAITARKIESISDLEARAPGRAKAIALDIADEHSIPRAVEVAIAAFGRIDILVNNAGIALAGAVEECSAEDVEHIFRTNVFGTLRLIRAVLPHMRERRSGRILTLSSVGGIRGGKGTGLYSGTKFALEGIHESLRHEVSPFGISVTIVEPGQTETNFRKRSFFRAAPHPDYAESTGQIRAKLGFDYPKTAGDPKLVAKAIITLVQSDRPAPLRLALGADAVAEVRNKIDQLTRDVNDWESLSNTVVPRTQKASSEI